ncbi:MAG: type I-E CRISPR-associated protein Cse1/CasA [Promethearchaeota archaeon]
MVESINNNNDNDFDNTNTNNLININDEGTPISYNLLDEKWIPVTIMPSYPNYPNIADPFSVMVSIRDIFEHAQDILKINCSYPTHEYGIYRMLLAMILDMNDLLGLDSEDYWDNALELIGLFERQKFPEGILDQYIEKYDIYNRFNLFDKDFPFYQVPYHPAPKDNDHDKKSSSKSDKKFKTILELIPILPTGNNPIFNFHINRKEKHYITAAESAQALVAISAFMTQGGRGYSPGINGKPPYYVLIEGNNLFETLVLNIPIFDEDLKLNTGKNPPIWRLPRPVRSGEVRKEVSTLEGLTLPPRNIHLFPEIFNIASDKIDDTDDTTVTSMITDKSIPKSIISNLNEKIMISKITFEMGLKLDGEWRDPYVGYRTTFKKGQKVSRDPIRPDVNKKIWQDITPLLFKIEKPFGDYEYTRASILNQIGDLVRIDKEEDLGVLEKESYFTFKIYFATTDQAKFLEWGAFPLRIPLKLTKSELAGEKMLAAISYAEDTFKAIAKGIQVMKKGEAGPKAEDLKSLQDKAKIKFWYDLENLLKEHLIKKLSDLDLDNENQDPVKKEAIKLLEDWKQVLKRFGKDILDWAIQDFDYSGRLLEAQVIAQKYYYKIINKNLFNLGTKKKPKKSSKSQKSQKSQKTQKKLIK